MGIAHPNAVEGIEITDRIEHYRVAGNSSDELHQQMRKLGPPDPISGTRYDGATNWSVKWGFSSQRSSSGCRLADIDVEIDVVIVLPDWQPSEKASRKLIAGWPIYLERLTDHEQGHRAIGVQAAGAVRDALRNVAPQPDCRKLMADAGRTAEDAMRPFKQIEREYDRQTRHGQTQGVSLPW